MGNYEQRYMYSTRTIFAVKLVAVEALLYKERTRSQHAHCSIVNGQASSRQLCIGINITSHQLKDFCPAEVFPQNLSKTCNSPAVGVTKVAINTELMLIVKFSFFLYILCKSRTKAFCVCDTSYTEYTIYILLYISITNLGLNVGVYRKMPSVLPCFSQILCSDARPFTCNIMKIHLPIEKNRYENKSDSNFHKSLEKNNPFHVQYKQKTRSVGRVKEASCILHKHLHYLTQSH